MFGRYSAGALGEPGRAAGPVGLPVRTRPRLPGGHDLHDRHRPGAICNDCPAINACLDHARSAARSQSVFGRVPVVKIGGAAGVLGVPVGDGGLDPSPLPTLLAAALPVKKGGGSSEWLVCDLIDPPETGLNGGVRGPTK